MHSVISGDSVLNFVPILENEFSCQKRGQKSRFHYIYILRTFLGRKRRHFHSTVPLERFFLLPFRIVRPRNISKLLTTRERWQWNTRMRVRYINGGRTSYKDRYILLKFFVSISLSRIWRIRRERYYRGREGVNSTLLSVHPIVGNWIYDDSSCKVTRGMWNFENQKFDFGSFY